MSDPTPANGAAVLASDLIDQDNESNGGSGRLAKQTGERAGKVIDLPMATPQPTGILVGLATVIAVLLVLGGLLLGPFGPSDNTPPATAAEPPQPGIDGGTVTSLPPLTGADQNSPTSIGGATGRTSDTPTTTQPASPTTQVPTTTSQSGATPTTRPAVATTQPVTATTQPVTVTTQPAAATATPTTAAPDFSVAGTTKYQHNGGSSVVCLNGTTTPAQPNADWTATISGPGVSGSAQRSGIVDGSGNFQATFDINQFGTYAVTASVTAHGVTRQTASTINVTSSPGQGCP